jgi:methionyl aminopeptidase
MVELKSPAEIEAMAEAGRVVAAALAACEAKAAVGVRLTDLDAVARDVLRDAGAESTFLDYAPAFAPVPYPAVLCTSVNDAVLHGIPTAYALRDGDVLSLDFGASIGGWASDAAVSLVVGEADPEDVRLVETTRAALDAGIAAARVGNRLGDVSAAIGAVAAEAGYGLNTDFGGHGIGRHMHEDPSVPNAGRPGRGRRIEPGLVIAIEPWFMRGGTNGYVIDDDGWTIRSADRSRTAHQEHTVAITEAGPRVLTLRQPDTQA